MDVQWLQYWWSFEQFDAGSHRCRSLLWFWCDQNYTDSLAHRGEIQANGTVWVQDKLSGMSAFNMAVGNHPTSYMNQAGGWFHAGISGVVPDVLPNILPGLACVCVKLHTADLSRNGIGHVFISGVPLGYTEDDWLLPTAKANYQAIVNDWADPWTAGGATFRLGVTSYAAGRILPITRATVLPRISILRKRRKSYHSRAPFLQPKPPPP